MASGLLSSPPFLKGTGGGGGSSWLLLLGLVVWRAVEPLSDDLPTSFNSRWSTGLRGGMGGGTGETEGVTEGLSSGVGVCPIFAGTVIVRPYGRRLVGGFSGGETVSVWVLLSVAVGEVAVAGSLLTVAARFPSLFECIIRRPGFLGSSAGFCGGTGFRFATSEEGRLEGDSGVVSSPGDATLCCPGGFGLGGGPFVFGVEVRGRLDLVGKSCGRGVGENRAGFVVELATDAFSESLSLSSLSSLTLESLRGTNVGLETDGLPALFSSERTFDSLLVFLMFWCGVFEFPMSGTLCSDLLWTPPNWALHDSTVAKSTESVSPAERSLARW